MSRAGSKLPTVDDIENELRVGRRPTHDDGTQEGTAAIDDRFNQHFPAAGDSRRGQRRQLCSFETRRHKSRFLERLRRHDDRHASEATATAASRAIGQVYSPGGFSRLRGLADGRRPGRRIAGRERIIGGLIDLVELR